MSTFIAKYGRKRKRKDFIVPLTFTTLRSSTTVDEASKQHPVDNTNFIDAAFDVSRIHNNLESLMMPADELEQCKEVLRSIGFDQSLLLYPDSDMWVKRKLHLHLGGVYTGTLQSQLEVRTALLAYCSGVLKEEQIREKYMIGKSRWGRLKRILYHSLGQDGFVNTNFLRNLYEDDYDVLLSHIESQLDLKNEEVSRGRRLVVTQQQKRRRSVVL